MDSSGARDMHPIALTLISLSVWVGPPAKLKPDESGQNAATHVTLQNNMLPGHLTIHEITRTVRRTVKRPKFVELSPRVRLCVSCPRSHWLPVEMEAA